jgi:polyhydroxyalkanoate synthesis regulator phasin
MSERRKGIPEAILEQGTRMATRAAKVVLDDPRGQEAIAAAVGAAQKGKRKIEEVQGRVLRAAGLPTRSDYDDVARSMARLKRKIRDLSKHVDAERKR